jgi:hypothetical protein
MEETLALSKKKGMVGKGVIEKSMKHYALDQWVDLGRGLGPAEDAIRMRNHLAGGCASCQREADFCSQLIQACQRLETQRLGIEKVPESVLRMAKAIFPVNASARPKRGLLLPIELIFDSFLVPSPVGLRATWQVGWQGLYRAGDCSVDVRIEPELKSARAALIGQITNHVLPQVEMANIPVSLKSGKLVVAETLSNRFGEFQMEYEQQAQLKLCITLQDGAKIIQVPLNRFTSDKPVDAERTSSRKHSAMGKQ